MNEELLDGEVFEPIKAISSKVSSWLDSLVEMIPNMLLAVILLIVFIVLAKLSKKIFVKIFQRSSDNKALQNLFATIIHYAVLGLGLFVILEILNLGKAVTSLLAGVGVLGLALGFAFQEIAANFISGIILAFHKPFQIHDIVKISSYMGEVTRTNLRVTVIETFQGQEVYIPNKEVLNSAIENYSILGTRRIDLAGGVSYAEDLKKVRELVLETIGALEYTVRHKDMFFAFTEFGGSSINFEIKFWIKYPDDPNFMQMRSNAIIAIKQAFDKNGITIPFPIRTLDFGIKGGKTLSEMNIDIQQGDKT